MRQDPSLSELVAELFWGNYSRCTCGARWADIKEESPTAMGLINVTYKCKTTRTIRCNQFGGDISYAPTESVACLMQQRNNLRDELAKAEQRVWEASAPKPAGPNYDHHHAHLGHMLHCNYCDFTFTIHSQDVAGITREQFFDPLYRLPCPSCREPDGYLHWRWACDAEVEADPANQDWVKETVRK